MGITDYNEPDIIYALRTPAISGEPEKAFNLLVTLEESEDGIVKEYDPNVKLLGAVNRHGVTCYLDSMLFAMFARLESFEAILYTPFEDEQRRRLATLLRLWVNTLRLGRLISTDIVRLSSPSSAIFLLTSIHSRPSSSKKRWPCAGGGKPPRIPSRMLRKPSLS